jgi:hypothetical protein
MNIDEDNIIELRKRTLRNTQLLEMGHMDLATAAVIAKNNEAIINMLKIQLAYAKARDEVPDIDYIKGSDDIKTLVVMGKKQPKRLKDKK